MDVGFVTDDKQTTTTSTYSRWQSFELRFSSSGEIVCNQPNFSHKMFVISGILAIFLVYAIIWLIRLSANFFLAILIFFREQIGGLRLYQQ